MFHIREKLNRNRSGFKGVGNILTDSNSVEETWNILKDNVSLPAATLSQSVLQHNQSWMNKFAEKFDFQLAPHGKTTMLPDLFSLQISSGCWGITLANATQVAAAYKGGVKRTIMANQLVGECNMEIISTILYQDPDFEFICIVDSPENVAELGKYFESKNQKIKVLLEYGPIGGRTGIRNDEQELAVVTELKNWPNSIMLVGIEFFEGILKDEQVIREFIRCCLARVKGLVEMNAFQKDEIIITGAGTSWFDVVAEEFLNFERSVDLPVKKILRSGCYLTYDGGNYLEMEKRVFKMSLGREENDEKYRILSETLKPALKIWAYVQSIPESTLAIVAMGRRDVAMDGGYPIPHSQFRLVDGQRKLLSRRNQDDAWKIFNMMDQHTFMRIGENDDIKIGDIISFDIYHPCTTMDKWRNVLLIDDAYNVLDVYNSEF